MNKTKQLEELRKILEKVKIETDERKRMNLLNKGLSIVEDMEMDSIPTLGQLLGLD